jgi:glyoxylase-like metal-dependent hydrolase (beta-lactamase superfamily II)
MAYSSSRVILAPNPGPMTLDGTNSYALRGPEVTASVIVDPGPGDAGHIAKLVALRPELILVTHRHADHTAASAELHRLTGAPVRAMDPAHCHGGDPLVDGELIAAAGVSIRVLATPGHTEDSVCLHLPDEGSILTGDTILGRGTTVLDGSLADYLRSLARLRELGDLTVLPGHGPELPSLADACDQLLAHRQMRLDEVRSALDRLGADATVQQVADAVYADVDPAVRFAAEHSVKSQLEYLRSV